MRFLTSEMRTAIEADVLQPVFFIEAEFRTGLLRMWSGQGPLEWSGYTWNATGGPDASATLAIEPVTEVAGMEATGLMVKVSGLESTLLGKCFDEIRIHKRGRMWMGLLDSTGALIDDPALVFEGYLDACKITESGELSEVTVALESDARRLQVANLRRLTLADQQTDFSTDTLFKEVAGLKNWKGTWGPRQVANSGGGGGGGGAHTGLNPGSVEPRLVEA